MSAFGLNIGALDSAPAHWDRRPLWTISRRRDVTGRPDAELLSVYRDYGVVPRNSREDNFNKPSDDLSTYRHVRPRDLVLNKMKTWQGSLGVSQYDGIVSPAYFVCELSPEVHARYIHHLLRSQPYVSLYMAASKGIRPSQWDLPFDEFRKLPALLPPLEEQRRIAQYLDGEVARLDALVNARILQSKTLRDWWQSYLASHMEDLIKEWGTIALRRIVSSVEQGWSPQCDDAEAQPDEWAVLKTSAVSSGRFLATEHKRLPADISPEVRYKIIDGDILMTRGSGSPEHVGVAVLARTEGRSLLLSDLLYRVRIGRARWSPEFVTLALSSRPIRGLIGLLLRGQSGQTIKLRGEDIKEICIPAAPLNVQHMISSDLALMRDRVQKAEAAVEESRILLAERRQALITAAVTGQFNVSSASGRGLTDGVPV